MLAIAFGLLVVGIITFTYVTNRDSGPTPEQTVVATNQVTTRVHAAWGMSLSA